MQSVARALSVLEALAAGGREIGIAELSKRVGLHASTVHRLLLTLMARGYVRQNADTGRYGLGPHAFRLGQAYLEQMDLRQAARPSLERLSHTTGETATLAVLDRGEALYLDKAESPQNLQIFTRIGRRAPLHCTAVGKVLLAHMAAEESEGILTESGLPAITGNTITSRPILLRELAKVRADGFAVDREECEEGACCLAAPIRDATGKVVAALGLSGPAVRLVTRRQEELVPLLLTESREVSRVLGFRPEEAALQTHEGGL